MLEAWKKMKVQAENEIGSGVTQDALLANDNKLKDKLFIEFGEDVDDAFAAFKFYGLNVEVTDDDRSNYSK